jgi:hypothetical protein
MSEFFDRIIADKQAFRKRLASLPFAEKVAILEKLRDRSIMIAQSPLRLSRKSHPVGRVKRP